MRRCRFVISCAKGSSMTDNLGTKVYEMWDKQRTYNRKVFAHQNRRSAEWMETYLLGLMSEVGELLTAMRWKKHRLNTVDEFGPGTLEELADITKYVISMWQLMGVNPEEMVDAVIEK